jgi:hypothetical protein
VIAVDSRGHDVLYSASASATVRSDDGGETWLPVGPSGTPAISPTYAIDGKVAVAVSGGNDYALDNKGQTSLPGSSGQAYDMSFAYAPGYPSAGKYKPVLLTAEDKSQRLPVIQQCTAAYACSGGATLAGAVTFSSPVTLLPSSAYANDGTVFAQSGRGIYKSTNGGAAFTAIPLGDASATATTTPMMALASGYADQGAVRTAWVSVFQVFQNKSDPKASRTGGGIYRTDDGGVTWHAQATPGPFDGGAISVAAAPDGRLFGGYIGMSGLAGLLCSTDGGSSWQGACPKVGAAANDPGLPAGTHVQTCTTCAAAAAPSGQPAAGASSSASVPNGQAGGAQGAGPEAGQAGASHDVNATATHSSPGPTWRGPVAGAAGVVLLLASFVSMRRRRRTASEPPPEG